MPVDPTTGNVTPSVSRGSDHQVEKAKNKKKEGAAKWVDNADYAYEYVPVVQVSGCVYPSWMSCN